MAKVYNRMSGKDLGKALPIIYDMAKRGVSYDHIAGVYKLAPATVNNYVVAYERYLRGQIDSRIERAVPFMQVQQASIKFTEERKRKPAEKVRANEPKIKTKNLILLWGMIKISW